MNKDKAMDFLAEYFDGKDYTLTGRREALRIAEYIISDIDILEDAGELAELLEKAEKWNRVKEVAEFGCYVCPFVDRHCPIDECKLSTVVKAIEATKEA